MFGKRRHPGDISHDLTQPSAPRTSGTPSERTTAPRAATHGTQPTPPSRPSRQASPTPTQPTSVASTPTAPTTPTPPSSPTPPPASATQEEAPVEQESPAPTASTAHEGRKLVVGRDISLSGEIKECDKLVVEGQVEAEVTGARVLEISETGLYKGAASVEDCFVSGVFDGKLTVAGLVVVRSTGHIKGELSYAGIEIERGGRISGTTQVIEAEAGRDSTVTYLSGEHGHGDAVRQAMPRPRAEREEFFPEDEGEESRGTGHGD